MTATHFPHKRPEHPSSLLVVGIASSIGNALFKQLSERNTFLLFGTTHDQTALKDSKNTLHLDLLEPDVFIGKGLRFDHVVFCAAITSVAKCESEPAVCHQINVTNTSKLIEYFSATGSQVTFLSSNSVFDGDSQFNTILDKTNPISNYGRYKAEVESQFLNDPNVAILRLTKVITSSTPFIKKWRDQLDRLEEIAVPDIHISPVYLEDLLVNIENLVNRRAAGLFHFGGITETTYADFARSFFAEDPIALSLLRTEKQQSPLYGVYNSLQTYLPTLEHQYQDLFEVPRLKMGLMSAHAYIEDPKRLAFTLSRYKFVSKMLAGKTNVLEIGCADGFGTPIVMQEVKKLTAVDFDWTFISDASRHHPYRDQISFEYADFVKSTIKSEFDAVYSLDVLEHITPMNEHRFLLNISKCLSPNGVLIVGIPSLESQRFASVISKAGHVNCKSGSDLKQFLEVYFQNVFLFSMNDEVVHTGFEKMSHYLLAVCCQKKLPDFVGNL